MNTPRFDPQGTAFFSAGTGTPLLLIHGVGLDARIWDLMVPELARRHRVITYEMLGHGGSALPSPEVTLADYATQACHLLDHLGIDACAVAGFSMGAMVAEEMAIRYPARVERLAAISGVFDRSLEQQLAARTRALEIAVRGVGPIIAGALERWLTPAFRAAHPELAQTIGERMRGNDPVGYLRSQAVFATADTSLTARVGSIHCPTLIVTGELDSGSTPEMAMRLGERIAGSQVAVLPGLRHLLPIEAPALLIELLAGFLPAEMTPEER
jgi:(E)-2-((N-methylformamido)methylene)succinate hydrolase